LTGSEPALAVNSGIFRSWRHFLAFGLGSGLARFAPGTFGTLVAIPFYLILSQMPHWLYAGCVLGAFAFGVWLCQSVSDDLGVHDHGGIVWDEFVGYWITMFLVPVSWGWVLAGFALFRLLDIWKPWPIRWIDRHVQGGLGIMLDDVIAGAAACIALHAIHRGAGFF
jgi:phosphatidylglycerophosphatase A